MLSPTLDQNKIYFSAKNALDSVAKRDAFTMYVVAGLLLFCTPAQVQKVVDHALKCAAEEE